MLKSFDEMRKIDVRPFCEERDGFLYLNWAKCIELLHENGAEDVYWLPIPNEKTGNSLRMTEMAFEDKNKVTNRSYETRIEVFIDGKRYEMQSPVMNGTNPVKDNSMSQQRVWNSMCRSFVKCVAIHTGLGFDLWLKEEKPTFNGDIPQETAKPSVAQIKSIKDVCKKNNVNVDYWIASNGKTWDTLTADDAGKMLRTLNDKYGE